MKSFLGFVEKAKKMLALQGSAGFSTLYEQFSTGIEQLCGKSPDPAGSAHHDFPTFIYGDDGLAARAPEAAGFGRFELVGADRAFYDLGKNGIH